MMDLRRIDWILVKASEALTLTPWEQDFIDDMIEHRECRGDRFNLSEKQEEILERIGEKS